MTHPVQVDVATAPNPYRVYVGKDLINQLDTILTAAGSTGRRFIVSSPPIWKLHGSAIAGTVRGEEPILIPDGERSKTLQTVMHVYEALIRGRADRGSTIVAVGGGVIGDTVGFAAATFLRGIQLVHIPSTLLAQVDSSIGGKVGVNHALGKNLIGAFHQPLVVVADPKLLVTLPRREFRAGLYEVIKYGVISSPNLFNQIGRDLAAIFKHDAEVLVPIIAESCRIKANIVAKDERESGLRRTLNFGHTVGHAIEAVSRYRRFRHGEAVAYGMLAAAHIAVSKQLLKDEDRRALAAIIAQLGPLPSVSDLSTNQILEAIHHDKKVLKGQLHVVLPTMIGDTTIVSDVTEDDLEGALRAIGMRRAD